MKPQVDWHEQLLAAWDTIQDLRQIMAMTSQDAEMEPDETPADLVSDLRDWLEN